MKTSNKDLMTSARESLSGRWLLAIGTFVLCFVIVGAFALINNSLIGDAGSVISTLFSGVFMLGIATFSLAVARNDDARPDMIFSGFKYFVKTLGLYLLMMLFIFLWMLLLIVPGIIAAISYSLAFFIMADDPSVGAMEALKKSKKMMYGYKWKFFCLCLRFTGWILLAILSLGVGFLWLIPYMYVSFAKFYDDLRVKSEE